MVISGGINRTPLRSIMLVFFSTTCRQIRRIAIFYNRITPTGYRIPGTKDTTAERSAAQYVCKISTPFNINFYLAGRFLYCIYTCIIAGQVTENTGSHRS